MINLSFSLKLAGSEAEVFLEHAGEMLGIFEAEGVGSFGDGLAVVQKGCGSLHDEVTDDSSSRFTRSLTDKVAEIVGRKKQFLGAITDGGQAKLTLPSFAIIAFQQVIVGCGLRLELTFIEHGAIFQYQFEVSDDDAAQVFVIRL